MGRTDVKLTYAYTVSLPDKDSDEWKELAEQWFEEEGQYWTEAERPTDYEQMLATLAIYLIDKSHVGDLTEYIVLDDFTVTLP